jgi:hypothetical protein
MQKKLKINFSFADSEFISYKQSNLELSVEIKAWNGDCWVVAFKLFAGLLDCGAGDLSDLVEETRPNDFYGKVLSRVFEGVPAENPYRLFQFLDLDQQPVLEVIACDVDVSLKSSNREGQKN